MKNIKSGEMKLEEAKKLHNVFKSNLNEISSERYSSEEQKSALENIKLLYKWREAVIKLFNDCSSIESETKYKAIHRKGVQSMSTRIARGRVAKVYDCKASYHSILKI